MQESLLCGWASSTFSMASTIQREQKDAPVHMTIPGDPMVIHRVDMKHDNEIFLERIVGKIVRVWEMSFSWFGLQHFVIEAK